MKDRRENMRKSNQSRRAGCHCKEFKKNSCTASQEHPDLNRLGSWKGYLQEKSEIKFLGFPMCEIAIEWHFIPFKGCRKTQEFK